MASSAALIPKFGAACGTYPNCTMWEAPPPSTNLVTSLKPAWLPDCTGTKPISAALCPVKFDRKFSVRRPTEQLVPKTSARVPCRQGCTWPQVGSTQHSSTETRRIEWILLNIDLPPVMHRTAANCVKRGVQQSS